MSWMFEFDLINLPSESPPDLEPPTWSSGLDAGFADATGLNDHDRLFALVLSSLSPVFAIDLPYLSDDQWLTSTGGGEAIEGPSNAWKSEDWAVSIRSDDKVDDVIVVGDRPPVERPGFDPNPGGGEGDGGWGNDAGGSGGGARQDPLKECGPDEQARAAAALFQKAAAAENQHLAYRERAAFIIRNDDGSYRLSGYTEGPPMSGGVVPDSSELTVQNVVGMIHNHPGGTLNPSEPDRQNLANYQNWISSNGGTQEFRLCIMANDGKIYVYDKDNMTDEQSDLEISGGC